VSSLQDVIASKKAKLLGDDSGDVKKRRRQVDDGGDAEDLEDGDFEQSSSVNTSTASKNLYSLKSKQ
jgi:hypothetical protein